MSYRWGVLAFVILSILPPVFASYITMQTTVTVNDTATVIGVTNSGDEPAYQVQIRSRVMGKTYEGTVQSRLDIGKNLVVTFPIEFGHLPVGSYPLLTTVYYQDASSYPFSALSTALVTHLAATRSEISLELEPITIAKDRQAKVVIRNFGETSKDISLKPFLSDEFIIQQDIGLITIASKQQATVAFSINNFGARPASTYAYYVIAEYDNDGEHFTTIASNFIKVTKQGKIFNRIFVIPALIFLGIILLCLQFMRKRKRK